jgi:hypothetical protein
VYEYTTKYEKLLLERLFKRFARLFGHIECAGVVLMGVVVGEGGEARGRRRDSCGANCRDLQV